MLDLSVTEPLWHRVPISKIEDLSDAVMGAGLEATQMSPGGMSGGLAFSENNGIVCTSGLIHGRVSLFGPLSHEGVTIGIGLNLAPGTRHWMNDVETGNVGVFLPGDEHDSMYTEGSLYSTVTLSAERLEEEAAARGLVLDRKTLGGTGVHARNVSQGSIARLERMFRRMHDGQPGATDASAEVLEIAIAHIARLPRCFNIGTQPGRHGRIVQRARAYIHANLAEPISVDDVASAALTSRRTLLRAFNEILSDTPNRYVRRLRLHRIRRDLANERERATSIALIAMQWGMNDIGRMAGWYRELFGELPSETRPQ